MKRLNATKEPAGFTLTELLVAVAISIVIILILGQVFSSATAMWQVSDQRIDAFRDARAALQLMAQDLGRANVNGNPTMLRLAQYSSDGSYASEADAVTPVKNPGKSDLCTVEYYLVWNASGSTNTFSLVRRFKNSDDTVGYLANSSLDFNTIYDRNKGSEETLAAPVWDLEFRPGENANIVTPSTDSAAKWTWVEIRFKTMSVNAARKLRSVAGISQGTWADPTTNLYKTLILPYEQQFVTRVAIDQNR
jgi:type II secretory pathway pseudopilin PulG